MTAGFTATAEDVARTGRDTTVAQWGVAAVVMVGSAASAGIGFHHLGEHAAIGVITGLGVDLALAAGLIIGRRLRAIGITTLWGTVLSWLTAFMALCLNSGAAALTGHWVLAVAHAFLPVLLVVVTEAGSEAQLKLHHVARHADAAQRAEREAHLAAQRAAAQADQRRDEQRLQRAHEDGARGRELAAAQHERQMTDRREEREQRDRQLVACLASVLALGAAWCPRRASQVRPSRSRPAFPAARTTPGAVPVPVVEELLSQARRVRAERASRGETAGRAVLQRELGVSERTARELVRRLDEQPLLGSAALPLQVVDGGRYQ